MPAPLAHSRPEGTSFPAAVNQSAITWLVAEEVPVAFEYNGRAHAVMKATPADLEDFALGFSLCEGTLGAAEDIEDIRVRHAEDGIVLSITADPLRLLKGSLRSRTLEGRSGCGLCGVDSLAHVVREVRPVRASFTPDAGAVAAAFALLPEHQPMNRANRSLHTAAWCDPTGRILLAREDVGRHNALDKLAGALASAGYDRSAGFAVLSSRCSFELVQKAAAVGIPLLATISAPTGLALTLARNAGMVLAARARGDGVMLSAEPGTRLSRACWSHNRTNTPRSMAMSKAESKKQQMAAGAALAVKRGEKPESNLRGASKEMAKSMTEEELRDLASTKRKDLPERESKD